MSIDGQITTWLDGIGLAQYATVFAENAIDLEVLPDVTEADLEKLGVALGHRKRILRANMRRICDDSILPKSSSRSLRPCCPRSVQK